ncbi:hypothetical protein BFJ67_g15604 [Fusarium oxysporum f. sp. cepae]|nr:hypothetical protein BFJ67_g15604 [Fusarium oxysporum f. sp. cepae]
MIHGWPLFSQAHKLLGLLGTQDVKDDDASPNKTINLPLIR